MSMPPVRSVPWPRRQLVLAFSVSAPDPPERPPCSRSHKGSALALMVELLAGAAVGAAVKDKIQEKSWGNLLVAVDPALLGDVAAFQVGARAGAGAGGGEKGGRQAWPRGQIGMRGYCKAAGC